MENPYHKIINKNDKKKNSMVKEAQKMLVGV